MAVSINWATGVISIPQADLLPISGGLYEIDVNALRLELKAIEDSEEGVPFPDTHNHNTEVILSGVTYARTLEIINGYTVTFEDVGTPYTVRCVGANHNIGDVKTVNQVSLLIGNSAGLITVPTGAGATAPEIAAALLAAVVSGSKTLQDVLVAVDSNADELHKIHGLKAGSPLTVAPTTRSAAGIAQSIAEAAGVVTVTRL